MYAFGITSQKEISRIWPDGRAVLKKAMSYQLMDFGVPKYGGGRTREDQKYLYAKGRTTPGPIVTWTLKSNHLMVPGLGYGFAFDVVPYIDGNYSWNERDCAILATIIMKAAQECGVELDWGFHLWRKDMPHFQKKGLT